MSYAMGKLAIRNILIDAVGGHGRRAGRVRHPA